MRRDYPAALELIVMRALEKRPEDRYQSAQELQDDLEEFSSESGLRSGNRRVAIYMHELFAPDAASAGAPAADEPEELDFDRRAPLSMRIEPAVEIEKAKEKEKERELDKRPSRPAVASATARAFSPGLLPATAPRVAAEGVAGPHSGSVPGRPRGSWIVLAAFIVLGIGAMVFLTLR